MYCGYICCIIFLKLFCKFCTCSQFIDFLSYSLDAIFGWLYAQQIVLSSPYVRIYPIHLKTTTDKGDNEMGQPF